jgi:two-component system, chemotaxis family, protein-glutamate methylesterase/glutaminase
MNWIAPIGFIERSGEMMFQIVVIGTSAGGLSALQTLLPNLAEDFPYPVVVVQHRSKESGSGLCTFLQAKSSLPVSEPEDKEPIMPGHVYLAPRDYHLLIERDNFALSTEAPVWYARPSINVLFESAADAYGEAVIGVILTGANADGARGLAAIKAAGGMAIVEEPSTAEAKEMPESAIAATQVDRILPLSEIATFLNSLSHVAAR